MTLRIAHRINTIEELNKIPECYGVEVDIRDHGCNLVLQHEPFIGGEKFVDYLEHYDHSMLILNIKSEGVEFEVRQLLSQYCIDAYFFLDCSFNMIQKLVSQGEHKVAVRLSEYEPIACAQMMSGKVNWVWVDCFTKLSFSKKQYQYLRDANYKICLTSPDLLNRTDDIPKYREMLEKDNILFDALCCKFNNFNRWEPGYF